MARPRATAYLEFRRKITSPAVIKEVELLCVKLGEISAHDVLYRWICEGAMRERDKRKEIEDIVKYNHNG